MQKFSFFLIVGSIVSGLSSPCSGGMLNTLQEEAASLRSVLVRCTAERMTADSKVQSVCLKTSKRLAIVEKQMNELVQAKLKKLASSSQKQ